MHNFMLFIFIASITIASPGPGVLLTLTNTITYSFNNAFCGIIGVALGMGCIGFLVAVGLGALITTSQTMLSCIKLVGALYLLYLGIKQFASTPQNFLHDANSTFSLSNKIQLFNKGFFVTLLNPKPIIFFLAFFPQFTTANEPVFSQYIYLTGIFSCLVVCIHSIYALFAQSMRKKVGSSKYFALMNKIGGSCFVLFAITLFISAINSLQLT